MDVGHLRDVICAAGVEQVQDRHRGLAGGIHAAKAVPECAARDGRYAELYGMWAADADVA